MDIMKFYLEALKNDIDIMSLDCVIEMDRIQFMSDYYDNHENAYKESCTSENELYTEAAEKFSDSIRNLIKVVIRFIRNCAEKVRILFTGKKIKELTQKYEDAIKKNPKLKDAKIYLDDDYNTIVIRDKNNNSMFMSVSKMIDASSEEVEKQILQEFEDRYNREKEITQKIKTDKKLFRTATKTAMTWGGVIALLLAAEARFMKNAHDRQVLLKKIETITDTSESKKIRKLGKKAEEIQYKHIYDNNRVRGVFKTLIDNIQGTTKQELAIILGAVSALDHELKSNKIIAKAAADNIAILDKKK
jgi:hypothetical protein